MFIQLCACLLVCVSCISLQSSETKAKKPINTIEQFKVAVTDMRRPLKPTHVSFINSSQSSPIAERADRPRDNKHSK